MSVGAAVPDDMRTAILTTQTLATDGADTIAIDATEDREIHAVQIHVDFDEAEEFTTHARVFLGTEPSVAADTALADLDMTVETQLDRQADATNGFASEYPTHVVEFPRPYSWEDNVTLSLHATMDFATNSNQVRAIVYYRELE